MTAPTGYPAERLLPRRAAPSWALILFGYAATVAGGLVAAVTGPLQLEHGSWVAAYLVLVAGVAQLALGWVPGVLDRPVAERRGWLLVAAWNLGNALVVTGTLAGAPLGVDAGSVLLLAALVVAAWDLLRAGPPVTRRHRLLGRAYLALLVLLAVSIPVGILLAHLR